MYLVFILFSFIYFLIYQNVIGGCLLASLFLLLFYSYRKGKSMLRQIEISFNQQQRIFQEGDVLQMAIEVPRQKIFETREVYVEVEYTSVIEKTTTKKREILLLSRRENGSVSIDYQLPQCDWITVEIHEFFIRDLCGCFLFRKKVEFHEDILVFPKELTIENGEISQAVEEYGNIRLLGDKNDTQKTDPYIYLDVERLAEETDMLIRRNYLKIMYSISNTLLLHEYKQHVFIGSEEFVIIDYDDYYMLFVRIFEVLFGGRKPEPIQNMNEITHVITLGKHLPVPDYDGKTIAVVGTVNDIDRIFARTEYVIVENMTEDLFNLSL